MRILIPLLLAATAALAGCESQPASPTRADLLSSTTHDGNVELAWFNGQVYHWAFPSQYGNTPKELLIDCNPGDGYFHAGLLLPPTVPANGTMKMYAVFLQGATQHSCPDGSFKHDHVLSAVPGTMGYSPQWAIFDVDPGPNFDPAIMPLTSEVAILNAAANGQVIVIDDQIVFHATVLGPAVP